MSDLSFGGVSLEQYARLCAAMAETGGDEAKEFAIAAQEGVGPDAWRQAKAGFTAKMQDPADMGRTAMAFMPLYQAAQAAARGGAEPASLQVYTEICAAYAYEQDPQGNQVPPELIYQRHGISAAKWNEITSYWTPKVNDPADPAAGEFRRLMQIESDHIFGIFRDERGSVVFPDDEDADPRLRALAQQALQYARRPIDGNPSACSPGAGPVRRLDPRTAASAAPAPAPAASAAPRPSPSAAPAVSAAPRPSPSPSPSPTPSPSPNSSVPSVGSLGTAAPGSSDENLWAALIHGGVFLGLAGFAPLFIWLMNKDGKNEYLAFRARQAMIAQFVALGAFIVVTTITCGFGALLIFPWMAYEGWMAYRAFNGERPGYPGMEPWPG